MQPTDQQTITIQAGQTGLRYWRDIWQYRELLYFLAWRDTLVRYKQTVVGILWAVLRPFLMMLAFTLVFSKLAKLPSNGVPYPILVFSALLPWQFFASAFAEAGNSLINNAQMVSKIYFPRLIIPVSTIAVSLVDFLISGLILAVIMGWYQYALGWHVLALPFFIALAIMAAMGAGLWVAALNVKYRDFRYIVPFVVQIGLYVSPVGFSSSIVPERWRLLYSLNPMVGVIDGFRWALLGEGVQLYWPGLMVSLVVVSFLLITGIIYFRKTERAFADII